MKRKLTAIFLAAAFLLSLCACAAQAATATRAGGEVKLPAERDPMVEVDAGFAQALLDFSAQSGEAVLLEGENRCYSPVSLYYALSLAGTGAAGETQKEIYALLGAENTETLSADLETLYRALYENEKHCRVYLANSVWMREGVTFCDDFTENAVKNFYAESYTLDFDAAGAGKTISDWVSEQTKGLLKPEVKLTPQTIAVLLNTVYFKANWADEFNSRNNRTDTFTKTDGSTVSCDFMCASRSANSVAAAGYIKAGLSMENGWQMFFVLPDEGETVDSLLENVGMAALLDDSAAEYREVEWSVPKFTAENELDLVPVLKTLGIEKAFSDREADFSAMCDVAQLPGGIAYISDVIQGTKLTVDEEGVEAAAYTELDMNCGAAAPPEETIVMDLDRPFLYGVQDRNGTVLFLGRCDDPA